MNDDIKIVAISKDINGLLVRFNGVKGSINCPSLVKMIRRIVPLPWIFQVIPYGEHKRSLEGILTELENHRATICNLISNTSEEKKDYLDLLLQYSNCLSESIILFLKIVTLLDGVSNNQVNYKWKDYIKDEDRFEESFESCCLLGDRLTMFYKKLIADIV
ncbi:MAG: hypothetical protein G3M78_10335 [Candidatus Nitrohelix vancouverensis]|uniref:Uncharacterized protein n=1 Tax=Candidatus Nitrohelix vancouverensis TaxID=2705534 RepID=A0A7T0G3T6_9BACT|nr:MAG: hypothetical protein G3M78_10335 [Candidatus Nitrohelix vancouverensis]